jgi:hypothetical protein
VIGILIERLQEALVLGVERKMNINKEEQEEQDNLFTPKKVL